MNRILPDCGPTQPRKHNSEQQSPHLSPLLSALLGTTIRDGLCNRTAFNLLADIYPYTTGTDRENIKRLLDTHSQLSYIADSPALPPVRTHCLSRPMTQEERFRGMLQVMRKYGGMRQNNTFAMLERYFDMSARINNIKNGKNGMADILSMMAGPQMSGMMNMMSMMQNMQNFQNMDISSLLGMMK